MSNNNSHSSSLFDHLPSSQDAGPSSSNYLNTLHTEDFYKSIANTADTSSDYYEKLDGRPRSITIVAWLLIISLASSCIKLPGVLKDVSYLPGIFWLILAVDYGLLIGAIVGLFQMKKYGAWLLVIQTVISTVSSMAFGATGTSFLNLVGSVIMLLFVFRKYFDMD